MAKEVDIISLERRIIVQVPFYREVMEAESLLQILKLPLPG
jgi:hypothetical protein